jgi:Methyltransferase domain
MPTFNRRPSAARAIAYFQRQTHQNRELVILDDGDDTIETSSQTTGAANPKKGLAMPAFYQSIEGWFDFDDIYELALGRYRRRSTRFVKIGASKGRSACYMAERIRELGLDIRFDVVDTFQGDEHIGADYLWPAFSDNLARAGLLSGVTAHRALSVVAVQEFATNSLDFVFIDATRTLGAVSQDIAARWPKLKTDGLIAGHRYACFPGVKRAVDGFVARRACGRRIAPGAPRR